MPADSAHNRWWEISEVVFGIPFLAAIALQLTVNFSLPRQVPTLVYIPTGATLIVLGLALIVLARREFRRYGQSTEPGQPTGKIVTTGVFAISRNPLYLGCVCLLAGIGLAADFPWVLILLLLSIIACHTILIAPEERYLAARFGEEYLRYTRSVRRWIGWSRA
jgi:protein-S-isoprenylcysteine O-methyltransferase Ste14